MSADLVALLDKLTFTGALLIAVLVLYRDSRAADRQRVEQNSSHIEALTEAIKLQSTQIKQLAQIVYQRDRTDRDRFSTLQAAIQAQRSTIHRA